VKLSTSIPVDNGAYAPKNVTVPASIAGVKKAAMFDPINLDHNAPVIHLGQLQFALRVRLVRTAEGQGRYIR
jgi:hypothetical protein